jgi:hypothetical protein
MPKITIEAAPECDGISCGQPLFNADGELNYVGPHSHLVEWTTDGPRYHAIACDFPDAIAEPVAL